jgi:hypothetical protein
VPTEVLWCEKAGTDSGTAVAQRPQPREFRKVPQGKTRKGRSGKCGGAQVALPRVFPPASLVMRLLHNSN